MGFHVTRPKTFHGIDSLTPLRSALSHFSIFSQARERRTEKMKLVRSAAGLLPSTLRRIMGPIQTRAFQHDFTPRDPKAKPKRYKYPAIYDPYGPRAPPSERVVQLAERIAALSPEERAQIGPTLRFKLRHPELQLVSAEEGVDLGSGPGPAAAAEDKKEKTVFEVRLEKFEAAAKIKVIKEVRGFTSLGLKEAKELVEKVPVVVKQGLTKDEAASIIDKIKAAGGVAVME